MNNSKLLIIDSSVLPEVYTKVVQAKQALASGEVNSASEAVKLVGISRSAFYKYKDSVYQYNESTSAKMVSIHAVLQDKPGVLMSLISAFYNLGANILTVNQNIPNGGKAMVSISAQIDEFKINIDDLLLKLKEVEGVDTIESITEK